MIETRVVEVERVRVLHHELAHAQQARLRARFVAELGLDLVPDLRQRAVRPQFGGDRREDLFVGHAEAEFGAAAVLQAEHLLAHHGPAARALPQLGRVHRREPELLGADAVHFLADQRLDLAAHAPAERKDRVDAGRELADQPGAHEQLVADGLGVGGIVAQRGNERIGPTHAVALLEFPKPNEWPVDLGTFLKATKPTAAGTSPSQRPRSESERDEDAGVGEVFQGAGEGCDLEGAEEAGDRGGCECARDQSRLEPRMLEECAAARE